MAKFGHFFISGIVWIIIAIGVGVLGSWLTTRSGLWAILGWPVAIIGFAFAGMAALQLWRITTLQMQGLKMMRDDPEGFEEARRRYQGVMRQIDVNENLIPLLNGIVQPLQHGAVQQINSAVQHIQDGNAKGRFMQLMLHVCLASILHQLESAGRLQMSRTFKDFAISQWDRPSNLSIDSDHKLFAYSQQCLGNALVNPTEDQLQDVGLTLLSIAVPDQEEFRSNVAMACGQAAHTCWQQASAITQDVIEHEHVI